MALPPGLRTFLRCRWPRSPGPCLEHPVHIQVILRSDLSSARSFDKHAEVQATASIGSAWNLLLDARCASRSRTRTSLAQVKGGYALWLRRRADFCHVLSGSPRPYSVEKLLIFAPFDNLSLCGSHSDL